MDNGEAIEWFEKRKNYAAMVMMGAGEMFELAISALEQQEKDRWVPITEKLPEKDCRCRVTEGDFKAVIDCNWNNHEKRFEVWSYYYDDYVPITNVTAWKLIEAPYTEEEI